MSRNTQKRNLECVAVVQWLFHSCVYWWILLSNSSFKQNFHLTLTTEHQPTRDLHSYTQAFAVIFPSRAITTKFASTRMVNDCFVVLDHLQRKFVNCIIKLLSSMKYFTDCEFSKHLYRWAWHLRTSKSHVNFAMFELTPRQLPTFRAWRLSTCSFCFNGWSMANKFQLNIACFEVIILKNRIKLKML